MEDFRLIAGVDLNLVSWVEESPIHSVFKVMESGGQPFPPVLQTQKRSAPSRFVQPSMTLDQIGSISHLHYQKISCGIKSDFNSQ